MITSGQERRGWRKGGRKETEGVGARREEVEEGSCCRRTTRLEFHFQIRVVTQSQVPVFEETKNPHQGDFSFLLIIPSCVGSGGAVYV